MKLKFLSVIVSCFTNIFIQSIPARAQNTPFLNTIQLTRYVRYRKPYCELMSVFVNLEEASLKLYFMLFLFLMP